MGITANSGPTLAYGITISSSGAVGEYNEQRGPSACDLGEMLLDPRPQFTYSPGAGVTSPVFGWAGLFGGPVVDQVPTTISSLGFISSGWNPTATPTAPLSTNTGQLTKISTFTGSTLTSPVTVFAVDGAMAGQGFGSANTINIWDPTKAVSRIVLIAGTTGSTGVTYAVKGFDLYGFAMNQNIIGSTGNTGTAFASNGATSGSLKAFKYIQSITATVGATGSTNAWVGAGDTYGFPLRVDHPAYATVWWGTSTGAALTTFSSVAHAFANLVTPTATTGDVRGTFASSGASSTGNGTRLLMMISPSVSNMATVGTSNVWTSTAGFIASTATGGINGALNFAGLVGLPQF